MARNAILTGERVYLRPIEVEDAAPLARLIAAETETFMERGRLPGSPLRQEHWFAEQGKHQPPEYIVLAVCLLADDRIIGTMELIEIDWLNRTAETGAWIYDVAYRGQGYGPEAKHLLLEYAFDQLHLHALRSWVFELNTRSAAAVQRQGYQPAGRVTWDDFKNGAWHDALLFDVLRDEWLAAREAWRARLREA
jgi:RimJ/RimL family protein N-acetyltransferase